MTDNTVSIVVSTQQFIGDHIAKERFAGGRIGVTNHNNLAFVHNRAVDQATVVGGPFSAPASCLNLELHSLVGQLQEALCAREQSSTKIGDQAKGVHIYVELIGHKCQLFDLGVGIKLRFIADQVIEPAVISRVPRRRDKEVNIGCDLDGFDRNS